MGDFSVDLKGLFPWRNRRKKSTQNPRQNSYRNLGISRPNSSYSTLQESVLDTKKNQGTSQKKRKTLGNANGCFETGFLKYRRPSPPQHFPNPSPTLLQPLPNPFPTPLQPPFPNPRTTKTPFGKPHYRGLTKGGFPKGWFGRMFPRNKPDEVHSDVPRNENRNEGTFACSPGTKTGTRVHSPKSPFYETALLENKEEGKEDQDSLLESF